MISVRDDGVTFAAIIARLKRRDVRLIDIRRVGQVDDEGRGTGLVAGVATEKTGSGVEAEIDKGVLEMKSVSCDYCGILG